MGTGQFTKEALLKRYLDNTITTAEAEELFAWLKNDSFENNLEVEQIMAAYYQNSFTDSAIHATESSRENLNELLKKINTNQRKKPAPVKTINRKWWMVAASIIILLGVGIYFNFFNDKQQAVELAKSLPIEVEAPKGNKAIITLSDGRQVSIDSFTSGKIAIHNNMVITKNSNGEIVYSGKENEEAIAYNTLYNPRGSKVQTITLADGTRVWLNAASSLRYPVAFSGKERTVELNGEGYFEVAPNAQKPFHVAVNDMDVEVLGTHFNINAYEDEKQIKTSLLEGSVKVNSGSKSIMIKPGEQAALANSKNNADGDITINTLIGDDVIAWKNGFFAFRHSDLNEILKQLSRWYDIDVDYKGNNKKQEFTGKIDRSLGLSDVLKILDRTGVRFKIEEGKRLTILNVN